MQPKNVQSLEGVIKTLHGCDSVHVGSEQVHELFQGMTAWQGTVEIFDLIGHPKAKRAYAWSFKDGETIKSVAVLEIPPVDSPQSAVKVAIAAKARQRQN